MTTETSEKNRKTCEENNVSLNSLRWSVPEVGGLGAIDAGRREDFEANCPSDQVRSHLRKSGLADKPKCFEKLLGVLPPKSAEPGWGSLTA